MLRIGFESQLGLRLLFVAISELIVFDLLHLLTCNQMSWMNS